jgi:two-component system sensor histidine kinase/response regulator
MNVFAVTEPAGALATEAADSTRLAGLRVLLTEDNEINQQIAVELLEGVGARVDIANNGREAVDRLGASPAGYDVVLMDLQMPEMDGYQATARIRSDTRFATLPIIAMTAHATLEERQRCLDAGMNGHVSKPIDPGLLFETVGRFYKPAAAVEVAQTSKSAVSQVPKPAAPSSAAAPADLQHGDTAGLETCATIPGLDTRDGLSRVAGNRKLYLKLLRQFIEQQGLALAQITTAFQQGDIALAERLAHTLKGVAGNIGAQSVQSAAGVLEKQIRDRAGSPALQSAQQQVAAALDPLIAQLRAALGAPGLDHAPPTPVPAAADPAQTREAAAQLTRLLSEFDPGAVDFIEANLSMLYPLFGSGGWMGFETLVQGYAFAEAQAQLEQALMRLPSHEN